jgi:hypothetical protein
MIAFGAGGVQHRANISEAGAIGVNRSLRSFLNGSLNSAQNVAPCSAPSPVSASNLVFLQENASGANVAISSVSVLAVLDEQSHGAAPRNRTHCSLPVAGA